MKVTQQEVTEVQIDAPRPNAVVKDLNIRNSNDGRTQLFGEVIFPLVPVSSRSQIVGATVTLTIRY